MFGAVRGIVSSLGLGSQVVMGATLLVTAFYVYRAIGFARIVSRVVGTVTREMLVLLVVGAIVIGLGWASPNSGVVWEHIRTLWAFGSEYGERILGRLWTLY